ncbi:MAG: hydrogenase maturation protease [Caldilineales bacterium]
MKTLVIGLGNPILTDDGVGVWAARRVEQRLQKSAGADVTVTEASVGGLRLMEMMVGYERVFLIDASLDRDLPPGSICRMDLDDLAATSPPQHLASAHDTTLVTALTAGRRMKMALPDDVIIYAIAAENVMEFGDRPTDAVAAAIAPVAEAVLNELQLAACGLEVDHGFA